VELGATTVRREPQDPDVVELAPRGPGRHIENRVGPCITTTPPSMAIGS
jgi:hypothetical protein